MNKIEYLSEEIITCKRSQTSKMCWFFKNPVELSFCKMTETPRGSWAFHAPRFRYQLFPVSDLCSCSPEETAVDNSSIQVPVIHLGDSAWVPKSFLRLHNFRDLRNEPVERISLTLLPSLSFLLSLILSINKMNKNKSCHSLTGTPERIHNLRDKVDALLP